MMEVNWDFWGVIIGIVLSFLTLFIAPFIDKRWTNTAAHFITEHRLACALSVVILAFIAWGVFDSDGILDWIKANGSYGIFGWIGATLTLTVCAICLFRARENLKTKLAAVESRPAESPVAPRFKRFEKIDKITYGHIAYSPLLYHDEAGQPHGVGITLLEMIFGRDRIEALDSKALWSDFVEELATGKYDIVATPIFETQERSARIAFCSPIFYSDIGMYVRKDHVLALKGPNNFSFDRAVENVRRMNPQVVAIEGEISGKMALKYLGLSRADKSKWLDPNKSSVAALIRAINSDSMQCEVAFAEVFQAEQTEAVQKKDVINILKPKAVLYPVSFAVRKQDYVLKRYINLKLLELEETVKDGVLAIVYNELQKHERYQHYTLDDIKRYFVRDYQEYGIREGGDMSKPPSEPPNQEWQQRDSPIRLLKGTRRSGGDHFLVVSNDAYAEG